MQNPAVGQSTLPKPRPAGRTVVRCQALDPPAGFVETAMAPLVSPPTATHLWSVGHDTDFQPGPPTLACRHFGVAEPGLVVQATLPSSSTAAHKCLLEQSTE